MIGFCCTQIPRGQLPHFFMTFLKKRSYLPKAMFGVKNRGCNYIVSFSKKWLEKFKTLVAVYGLELQNESVYRNSKIKGPQL